MSNDALWYDYSKVESVEDWHKRNYGSDGRLLKPDVYQLLHESITKLHSKNLNPGETIPETKEKSRMSYDDQYGRDRRSDQELIDDAVREALAKPRREAEIAKCVALISTLEPLTDVEVGTVITFKKKNDRGDKVTFSYAAIKVDEDLWAVTGDGRYSNGTRQSFQNLLDWLTTGPNLVEDVRKATGFEPVSAPATKS